MTLYIVGTNPPTKWTGQVINDIRHPRNIEHLWSDAELAGVGLIREVEADPVPYGKVPTGSDVSLVGGKPKLVRRLEDIVVTRADVKAEAFRRITELFPLWKQINHNQRRNELLLKRLDGEALTVEEQAEGEAMRDIQRGIEAIRTASDVLEEMTPIPIDFQGNKHWT
jgi:hypothetical protein